MTKPHEQEWEARTNYVEFRSDTSHVGHADVFAAHGEKAGQELIAFIAAAPYMARALLDVWSGTLFYRDGADVVVRISLERWEAIGAALKKAGTVPYSP